MDMILGMIVMLTLPGYVWAQGRALLTWRGWPLGLACVPLVIMLGLVGVTIIGFVRGSNLAPLLLILAAPVCLVWLGVVSLFRRWA